MPPQTATIIGLGISGAILALALKKHTSLVPTIYELRSEPTTLGGAILLSPPGQRLLANWNLLELAQAGSIATPVVEMFSLASGKLLGKLPFGDKNTCGVESIRIERSILLDILLRGLADAGIPIIFNKQLVSVTEPDLSSITTVFADGSAVNSTMVFGCDGIHSTVRKTYVDPDRFPTYSGIAGAYGFAPRSAVVSPIHFDGTAVNMSSSGSLITTYCDQTKTKIFVAAVIELPAPSSTNISDQATSLERDGFKARGNMEKEARDEIIERFKAIKHPCIKEMIEGVESWFFFPIYVLPESEKWSRGRAVIIGDAAHAMPPQGQSAALAMEDGVILARYLGSVFPPGVSSEQDSTQEENGPELKEISEVLALYTRFRAPRVHTHHAQATNRFVGPKNHYRWVQMAKEFFLGLVLMWLIPRMKTGFEFDAENVDLGLNKEGE
jgi:salicylate hydroxylase